MNHGLPLFDHAPRSRASDPATSHEAGEAAAQFAGEHHQAILRTLHGAGRPLAAEQIADALGWPSHHAANRRLSELCDGGLIERTAERHTNRSGRDAYRYKVTE